MGREGGYASLALKEMDSVRTARSVGRRCVITKDCYWCCAGASSAVGVWVLLPAPLDDDSTDMVRVRSGLS